MAKTNRFYEYIELKYDNLTDQINTWLKTVYNKSAINLGTASPYGQILLVLKEYFQNTIIYLKNAVKMLDIKTSQNIKVVRETALIAGHNPSRSISATGTLKLKIKPGVDIAKEIKDSIVVINNGLLLKNKTNSLKYVADLNVDKYMYQVTSTNNTILLPIVQGNYETQSFTADGKANFSISVNIPGTKQIDNFNYSVTYNGIMLTQRDHLYDLLPAEYGYYCKSGFNGGIDVFFGNGNFGFVPILGSIINVKYLLSDGSSGIILNNVSNDWKIDDDVFDGQGNSINVSNLFDITIETDVNFGSDGETIEFTKAAVPYVSRNFVLGTPNQFIYHLKKLNMFSKVNAYNKLEDNDFSVTETVIEDSIKKVNNSIVQNKSKSEVLALINDFNLLYSKYKTNKNDNEIYLYLIPSIVKYFNDSINYFNIPFDVFYLDSDEQNKIISYLRQLGTLSMTIEPIIVQPKISRYVMHVYINCLDYADEATIRQQVISDISNYFLTNDRFDRIPKADFISLIKLIDGVDSATVLFVSKKNEDYHKMGIDLGYEKSQNTSNQNFSKLSKTKVEPILQQPMKMKNGVNIPNSAYNPKVSLGIDPTHGDIICDIDEYAIVRGGWVDRNGVWYNDDMSNQNSLNSINITITKNK